MSKPFGVSATVQHRRKYDVPPAPEGCAVTAAIARGRKRDAREDELSVAEQVASGVIRRKPTGIYKRRA